MTAVSVVTFLLIHPSPGVVVGSKRVPTGCVQTLPPRQMAPGRSSRPGTHLGLHLLYTDQSLLQTLIIITIKLSLYTINTLLYTIKLLLQTIEALLYTIKALLCTIQLLLYTIMSLLYTYHTLLIH